MTGEADAEERDEDLAPPRRRPGGRLVGGLLFVLVALFLVAAAVRLLGLDANRYTVALIALTPYVLAVGFVLAVFSLLARRWIIGLLALVLVVILGADVAGRVLPDSRPFQRGPQVRVLSANLSGHGNARAVVDWVRRGRVDVLSLQGLTPEAVAALDAAGLRTELPYREFEPTAEGTGSGLAARFPLRRRALAGPSRHEQPSAWVDVPGSRGLEVVVVHAARPLSPAGPDQWRRELAGLPAAPGEGPPRILAGTFNATLDHAPLRALVNQGYRDAAAEVGRGLVPTWPADRLVPLVALDHVLVDRRCAVDDLVVLDVSGSAHRAVLTTITMPG
ncbi:endonuclease/exonuclease/phosphatase family protein [Longimycelium tulufanense]|uniref:endonuclease/exonuclease/phosphatase family protein n=1 Tax=Longimycelium tulufanense TaxID=907463 RepID=UPI001E5896CC|nr:endonuclease/exonuclease/phosphatase family protein [Longimycelium tulufanense]